MMKQSPLRNSRRTSTSPNRRPTTPHHTYCTSVVHLPLRSPFGFFTLAACIAAACAAAAAAALDPPGKPLTTLAGAGPPCPNGCPIPTPMGVEVVKVWVAANDAIPWEALGALMFTPCMPFEDAANPCWVGKVEVAETCVGAVRG